MKEQNNKGNEKFEIAKRLYSEERYQESIQFLKKAIDYDNIKAYISLALIYKSEIGYINYKKAYQLLEKAISMGSSDAEIELANFDNNGINSKIGEIKSVEIYMKYLDKNHLAHFYYGKYLESKMKTFEDYTLVKDIYERGLKLNKDDFHLNKSLELLNIKSIDEEIENIENKIQVKQEKRKKLLIKEIVLYAFAVTIVMTIFVITPALNAQLERSVEKQKIIKLEQQISYLKEKQQIIRDVFINNY